MATAQEVLKEQQRIDNEKDEEFIRKQE